MAEREFGLEWLYDEPWQRTPFWLRWLGWPRFRRRTPQNNVRGTMGMWQYSDQPPAVGGLQRARSPYWRNPYVQ